MGAGDARAFASLPYVLGERRRRCRRGGAAAAYAVERRRNIQYLAEGGISHVGTEILKILYRREELRLPEAQGVETGNATRHVIASRQY